MNTETAIALYLTIGIVFGLVAMGYQVSNDPDKARWKRLANLLIVIVIWLPVIFFAVGASVAKKDGDR